MKLSRIIESFKKYKNYKGLRKESLRDNMTRIAKLGGHAAKSARDDLEKN